MTGILILVAYKENAGQISDPGIPAVRLVNAVARHHINDRCPAGRIAEKAHERE
jgi:hypothetical protein